MRGEGGERWQAYFGGVVGVELDYDCALERDMLAIVTGWLRGGGCGEYHCGFESNIGSHDAIMFNRGLDEEVMRLSYICSVALS